MTSKCLPLVLCLVSLMTVPLSAASDGTVKGTLTVNKKEFPLTHIYARKREAWPADQKTLRADDLSCGIVDVIMTNAALSDATITGILQNEYRGSEKVRGVRFVIDGSGSNKWQATFLLESGEVRGYGTTQTNGELSFGARVTGKMALRNDDVTETRMFDLTFDAPVTLQYARLEAETAERIPDGRIAEEFVKMMPGEWTIKRWLGLSCTTASGKLVVGERISPHAFHAVFHITTSKGDELEEEATISLSGTKVHVEGGKVNVPKSIWAPDVLDLDFWQNLMIGNNATDFVVLQKKADALSTR